MEECGSLEPLLGSLWCPTMALLVPYCGAAGCSWAPLGVLLAALGAVLGLSRAALGPLESLLGLNCCFPGDSFGTFLALLLNALEKSRTP